MADAGTIRFRDGAGSLVLCAALLCAALAAGCDSRPSAPPLEDGPVYKNQREGFRFFVPEGWKQRARGEAPPGKLDSERMLAEYQCLDCIATLMITVVDVPASTSLHDYLSTHNLTGENWRLRKPAEEFTLNGAPAARILYASGEGASETLREIVAFRRGERVYFFKSFCYNLDTKSRKALQAAVDTIVW